MNDDKAECGKLSTLLQQLGQDLDQYLQFDYSDAMKNASRWHQALEQPLPEEGIGIQNVMSEMRHHLIPNGSPIPHPGCTAFITTGTTSIGALANLASAVVAPQRMSLTAFNLLEELSLQWMAEMFELPPEMKGLYSSGGSVANIVALGAARQHTFEQRLGIDPSKEGLQHPGRIYATEASHHTIHRAAAVLGLGRNAVITIASDTTGRMSTKALQRQLEADAPTPFVPVAIVANAGTTSTGTIDSLKKIGEIAHDYSIWFHIDGAYGLPGILDPKIHHLYDGLSLADSVIIDPHKWLGAPVGIGATFVRDRTILQRAFTQEATDYLEGSMTNNNIQHSMDNLGIPYSDFGLELSAPSRGAVVWALIREIGKAGLRERVCRHNAMAKHIAKRAHAHPNLEVVQEPTLSICCFRYVTDEWADLNELNSRIHRQLVHNNRNIPSTALVRGTLAIRPCFIGARTTWQHANDLVEEVIEIGQNITNKKNNG